MRGPFVGALLLAMLLIALATSQAPFRGVSLVPRKAATVGTAVATPTMGSSQAKAGERSSRFKTLTPVTSISNLKTKASRTVIPHKLPASAIAAPAPRRPLTVSSSVAPRVTTYNALNAAGITAGDNATPSSPPDSTGAIGPNYYA